MQTVHERPSWFYNIVALICGTLLPFAFAPLNLYPLAIVIPGLLFWCWQHATPRQALWRGYLFGLGLFGVGVSWVYIAISDFGFTSAPVAMLLTSIFVAFLAWFPALQGWLSVVLVRRSQSTWSWLFFPLLWVLFEWIRGWFMTGFPWLNLGYSQIDSVLAGYAPIFGVYALSVFSVLSGALLWQLSTAYRRSMVIGMVVMLVVWAAGFSLQTMKWTQPIDKPLNVAIVQGNLPQITKWDPEQIMHRMQTYADLSQPHWGKQDLIVWPENALTILWQDVPASFRDSLMENIKRSGTSLIIGLPYGEVETAYYSSLLVLGDTPGVYHKRHLVPFGEYVPLAGVLRKIGGFFNLPMSGFSAGEKQQAHLQVAGQLVAPSICYEDAFGEELIDFLPQATLLVNGSNNAWYGDSWAPHQHLQIARMRALETGRELIRATTTGISACVDHHGEMVQASPQFETVVLQGQVQPRQGATPFVRWGNWPVLILLWLMLLIMVIAMVRQGRTNS